MSVKSMKVIACLLSILFCTIAITAPVFAECPDGSVPTAILGNDENIVTGTNGERCLRGTSDGSALSNTLKTVLEIMTIGIGVLGVLGITIVGIQYLTAGGNEEKTRKAKRRLFEIVIGLVVYAVISSFLYFLSPSGSPNTNEIHWDPSTPSSTANKPNNNTNNINNSNNSNNTKKTSPKNAKQAQKKAKKTKELQKTIKAFAWPKWHDSRAWNNNQVCSPYKTNRCTHYINAKTSYKQYAYSSTCGNMDCGVFVKAAIKHSGWDSGYSPGWGLDNQWKYLTSSSKWTNITKQAKAKGNSYLEPGDIIITKDGGHPDGGHVLLYTNTPGFQSKFVEAGYCRTVAASTDSHRRNIKTILNSKSHNKPFYVFRRTKW